MALTGDTLFVGEVGRPDLVGADAARALAANMYESLNEKILPLPDSLIIYPGHGEGSLCGRAMSPMRVSTLGFERRHNPALGPRTRDEFITFATSELPEQPGNHIRIKALNREGPPRMGEPVPHPLTIEESIPFFQDGAALLDTRPKEDYSVRHIPGSLHLEANEQLSNRIGFLLPAEIPVVLLLNHPDDYRRVAYMLARVGYENIAGYLAEDLDMWEALGLPTESGDIRQLDTNELQAALNDGDKPALIDVREPWEYRNGHVPGARLIPMGELPKRVGELDAAQPLVLICESGSRSQNAAAWLAQKGFKHLYNAREGTGGWRRRGLPLER